MRLFWALVTLLLFPVALSGAAAAGTFDDAVTAYNRGDYATAISKFRLLAEQGDAVAQFNVGAMYEQGQGVPQNYPEAAKWFELAAKQGNAGAQFSLGSLYYEGTGVLQNYPEAARWFELAAKQGHAFAQFNLGLMYYDGTGVPQNYAEAVKWLRPAAAQGDAKAQNNLGWMYALGQGVPQNYAEAVKWLELAAKQGHANAQFNLGWMYEYGRGVPQNYPQAFIWLSVAASNDSYLKEDRDEAVRHREFVASKMTPAQITQAQGASEQCLRSNYTLCAPPVAMPGAKALEAEGWVNRLWRGAGSKSDGVRVKMLASGDLYQVPVLINDTLKLNFIIDSGASDVSIPEDVVLTLIRTGTIEDADFVGTEEYRLADGSTVSSRTFVIRSLKVGDRTVTNVRASITNVNGSLLLGQSFLNKFKSWSQDNVSHELVLR
jgi:TPR repeat protein